MGFRRLITRFRRTVENPSLSISKSIQNLEVGSTTNSLFTSPKSPILIQSTTSALQNSFRLPPNHSFKPPFHPRFQFSSIHSSIHGDSVTTTVSDRVAEDSEKICKILSNSSGSPNIDHHLDRSGVRVSPELLQEVLKKLSNAGALALSFFRWAEKQQVFKPTTESYNALIESLGKIKQFKLIWNLVNTMKNKGLLTRDTFALIIRRYARARKIEEAVEAFETMEKFGLKPELSDFNRLIDTLSKSRHVKKAHQLFDEMKKRRRFEPDLKSYTILLEGWGQEQNLMLMKEVYREMRDEGFKPDAVTYGITINAYCKCKKFDEAIELFREMEAKKCKPTPHIYCTLINGLGSEKRLDEALEFFEQSKENGFIPELPTYNAVVGSYCSSMRFEDAYRVVDEIRSSGFGPNSRTYDIILHHLIKARRTKEAYWVFQRMSSEFKCEPSLSTYIIMANMFCNEERVDLALKVWEQMKGNGVLPSMHMFSSLINGLCVENKLEDACNYFQEMLALGIRPPGNLYSNLKQALLEAGKNDVAISLGLQLDKIRKTPLAG